MKYYNLVLATTKKITIINFTISNVIGLTLSMSVCLMLLSDAVILSSNLTMGKPGHMGHSPNWDGWVNSQGL